MNQAQFFKMWGWGANSCLKKEDCNDFVSRRKAGMTRSFWIERVKIYHSKNVAVEKPEARSKREE
jgi:hypothetical protein